MNKINSYTSWQPLEEVIVGRAYSPDYFDFIDNPQVRNQLQQILAETEEDLDNLSKTIEKYGARVRRPNLPGKDSFIWHQTEGGGAPLPPLTPRDWQITLGDKLLRVLNMEELDDICADFGDQVVNPHKSRWDEDCILNGASASCIVRVGRDVFFDNSDFLRPDQTRWIVDNVLGEGYRIHEAITDGHGDAVFAILKPGVLLSSKHDVNLDLAKDFPGWDVCKIWDSSIWAAMEVGKFKYGGLALLQKLCLMSTVWHWTKRMLSLVLIIKKCLTTAKSIVSIPSSANCVTATSGMVVSLAVHKIYVVVAVWKRTYKTCCTL